MGYIYEFPHSRMFDSDLREILELFGKLSDFADKYGDSIKNFEQFLNSGLKTIYAYGAKGDGITDDSAAFEESAKFGYVIIPNGKFYIPKIKSIEVPILFADGKLVCDLEINSYIYAPPVEIFDKNSTITNKTQPYGFPEWFGVENIADKINLSLKTFNTTYLQGKDYHTDKEIIMDRNSIELIGVGGYYDGDARITRIIRTNAGPILIFGNQALLNVNDFPRDMLLKNINFWGNSVESNDSIGVIVGKSISGRIENVKCSECNIGFKLSGSVHAILTNCHSFATASFHKGICYGFYWSEETSIGLAGNNASLRLDNCGVSMGGNLAGSIGLFLRGHVVDLFVNSFETAHCATGISIDTEYAVADAFIRNAICDQCSEYGIYIHAPNSINTISLTHSYFNLQHESTGVGIRLNHVSGLSLADCQVVATSDVSNSSATGINGEVVKSKIECTIKNMATPAWLSGDCSEITITTVQNTVVNWLIQVIGSKRTVYNLIANDVSKYDAGIAYFNECEYCTINLSKIDPSVSVQGRNRPIFVDEETFGDTPIIEDIICGNNNNNKIVGCF